MFFSVHVFRCLKVLEKSSPLEIEDEESVDPVPPTGSRGLVASHDAFAENLLQNFVIKNRHVITIVLLVFFRNGLMMTFSPEMNA